MQMPDLVNTFRGIVRCQVPLFNMQCTLPVVALNRDSPNTGHSLIIVQTCDRNLTSSHITLVRLRSRYVAHAFDIPTTCCLVLRLLAPKASAQR